MTKGTQGENYSRIATYLGLVFTSLTYAATPYFVRVAILHSPTMSVVFMRFFFGAVFLSPLFMRQEASARVPKRRDILPFVLLGGVGIFVYHYLFFAAVAFTSPVNVAMLSAMLPIFSVIVAAVCGKERFRAARGYALTLSFLGVLLVLSRGNVAALRSLDFNKGDLMMLVAVLCFSTYGVVSKGLMASYSAISASFFGTVVTVLFALPFFIREFGQTDWSEPSVWITAIYTGLFPSCFGLYFQMLGIQRIGVGRAIGFLNLVPVFSVVISLFVLGFNSVSLVQIASMFLILFGVFWNSRVS